MRVQIAPGRYLERPGTPPAPPPTWAYGVTTVPGRRETTLPQTLRSLREAGFDRPWLFVDGSKDVTAYRTWEGLDVTFHSPALGVVGNWILSLWELWVRFPDADRYALFQDDLLCVRGLKDYLSAAPHPEKGYLNLFTFLDNESVVKGKPPGWYRAVELPNDNRHWQRGRSALALAFDAAGVEALLSQQCLVHKARDTYHRGRRIDGGIVNAMNTAGYSELVHAPSLVTHTGNPSSIGNLPYPAPLTWPGEGWDARQLLLEKKEV